VRAQRETDDAGLARGDGEAEKKRHDGHGEHDEERLGEVALAVLAQLGRHLDAPHLRPDVFDAHRVVAARVEFESKVKNQDIISHLRFKGWVTRRCQALWVNWIQFVQPHHVDAHDDKHETEEQTKLEQIIRQAHLCAGD
jgi:uncharacterized metal-binding protein YceD (DUF177 family)